jgi:hypothetical protein
MEISPWTCPTCGRLMQARYCPGCGEEPLAPADLTLRGVSRKLLHALTSVDARVLHTARCLLSRPGELTLAWTRGTRREYVAPFQIFLIANLAFFALQSMTSTNIFSSPLSSHLHQQDWKELAQSLLAERLAATGLSLEQYAPLFDRAVVLNAKSLILLMTLPFALVLPLVFSGARRPFMVQLAFSLHLYTFMLLVFCVALLAGRLSGLLGFGGLDAPSVDTTLSLAILVVCAAYLYFAIEPVYGSQGAARAIQAIGLSLIVGAIALGYRFALFVITLYGS